MLANAVAYVTVAVYVDGDEFIFVHLNYRKMIIVLLFIYDCAKRKEERICV